MKSQNGSSKGVPMVSCFAKEPVSIIESGIRLRLRKRLRQRLRDKFKAETKEEAEDVPLPNRKVCPPSFP